jgi:uncharacterized protein (DUF2236 family)
VLPASPALPAWYGYFGPDTMTWRLYREPIFLLGGIRALLLQVAHPAVADGVARYSNFRQDALGRGYRTFMAMATIYFGDHQQADITAGRLSRVHRDIKGVYPDSTAQQPYTATDAALQLWVFATLTDTTLYLYEHMPGLHRLPADWREQFYEESKRVAALFGIPPAMYPPDLPAFRQYMQDMLEGDLLGSTPECRAMSDAIMTHRLAIRPLFRLLAAGGLPTALAQRLGIRTRPDDHRRCARLLRRLMYLTTCMPKGLRFNPAWHQAMYRVQRHTPFRCNISFPNASSCYLYPINKWVVWR